VFPKFIEERNRLLPDGAAYSARCMGSAHIAHVAQQSLYGHVHDWKGTRWPPNNSGFEYHVWGATRNYFLKPSSEAPNSFWLKSRTTHATCMVWLSGTGMVWYTRV